MPEEPVNIEALIKKGIQQGNQRPNLLENVRPRHQQLESDGRTLADSLANQGDKAPTHSSEETDEITRLIQKGVEQGRRSHPNILSRATRHRQRMTSDGRTLADSLANQGGD